MDREDIYALTTALDDVVDAIEAAGDLFVLHNIQEPRPSMIQQADVLVRAARQTEEAVKALESLDRAVLEPYWIEINSLENEGDRLYRRSVADMFSGRPQGHGRPASGRTSPRRSRRRSTAWRTSQTSWKRSSSSTPDVVPRPVRSMRSRGTLMP